jgi:hypothetical protein
MKPVPSLLVAVLACFGQPPDNVEPRQFQFARALADTLFQLFVVFADGVLVFFEAQRAADTRGEIFTAHGLIQ